MQPDLRKLLFFLFLWMPGLLLQFAGVIAALYFPLVIVPMMLDSQTGVPLWASILVLLAPVIGFAIGAAMQAISEKLDHGGSLFLARSPIAMARQVAMKSLILLTWVLFVATFLFVGTERYVAAIPSGVLMAFSLDACLELFRTRPRRFSTRLKPPAARHEHKPVG